MSLDILITTKNNEYYWTHHFPKIWNNLVLYNPTYYIYENNSTDKTRLKLEELQKTYPNIIIFLEGSRTYLNRYLNVNIFLMYLLYIYHIIQNIPKPHSLIVQMLTHNHNISYQVKIIE